METLSLSHCVVDLVRGRVQPRDGADPRRLTTREVELLRYFAARPSALVSRDELMREVWGYDDAVVSRACDNAVARLRAKIERDPASPDHLLTVHGEGYRFEPLADAQAPPAQEPVPELRELRLHLGAVEADLARGRVSRPSGEVLELSAQEVAILTRLWRAGGRPVDREALMREVWGGEGTDRALISAISRLRAKIEPDPREPRHLRIAASGYLLDVPVPVRPEPKALVGRDALLAEIRTALGGEGLVELVGPRGIGKTSLAALAADGTWIDLGGVRTPEAVAAALPRAGAGGLVVLDRADEAAPVLREWIPARRDEGDPTRWLVISAVALGVGERRIEVGPLSEEAAVELFVQRARPASRELRISAEMHDRIRALVRVLEGNPAAIELAAARLAEGSLDDLGVALGSGVLALGDDAFRALAPDLDALPPDALDALLRLALLPEIPASGAAELLGPGALDRLQTLRERSLLRGWTDGGVLWLAVHGPVRERCSQLRASLDDGGEEIERELALGLARFGSRERFLRLWAGGDAALAEVQRGWASGLLSGAERALRIGEVSAARAILAGALLGAGEELYHAAVLADELLSLPSSDPARRAVLGILVGTLRWGRERERASDTLAGAIRDAISAKDAALEGIARLAALELAADGVKDEPGDEDERWAKAADATARAGDDVRSSQIAAHRARLRGDGIAEATALHATVAAARRSGEQRILGLAQAALGRRARAAGRLDEAAERMREATLALRTSAPQRERAIVAQRLAEIALAAGGAQAIELGREAAALAGGTWPGATISGSLLAAALLGGGEIAAAKALLADAGVPTGPADLAVLADQRLAESWLEVGELGEALSVAQRAAVRSRLHGDVVLGATSDAVVARVRLAAGERIRAHRTAEQAWRALRQAGTPEARGCAPWVLCALIESCLALGDEASARELRRELPRDRLPAGLAARIAALGS